MNIFSMLTRPRIATLAAAAALMVGGSAFAEDIDIYAGGSGGGGLPNVLLILDSSANWSDNISGAANCYYKNNKVLISPLTGPVEQGTKLGIEQCALYNLVDALPVSNSGDLDDDAKFMVAIMLMNESPKDGTYPRQHFIKLTSNNKAALKSKIASFDKNNDKANNADYGLAMYEAYLYFKGATRLNGGFGPSGKLDNLAFNGNKYVSPSGGLCGGNHIIVIGNGSPQNSSPENNVENLLRALPANSQGAPDTKPIAVPLAGNDQKNWSDEMSRYMRFVDVSGKADAQGIISHAIAVKKGPSDGGFPYLMNSIASQGGGSFFEATSADELVAALGNIFDQIQAVNSVFSSASLPVSVNLQGSFENQIFLGMFRPDANVKPRWPGNMKQYKFGLDKLDNLFLADAAGKSAVSASTGFFNPSAVSYWTSDSTFWDKRPSGTPASGSDAPDGEIVEKGGAAQRLRIAYSTSQATRKVLTCVGCAAGATLTATPTTGATAFHNDNTAITQAALVGTTSAAERTDLINWIRGTDNKSADNELGPNSPRTVRPSIHGDVLHSRPAVVNYGGTNGVVVFYGGNDGMLHAIKGNQSTTDGGDELWAFVPQELFGKLNRLRANSPPIRLSTSTDATATPRDYFVDGPIGVYRSVNASNVTTKAILYVTMRRGGRFLYAIDVTDPTTPKYLWKVSNSTTGMAALGQTWSTPKVARVKGRTDPVVIFGGGYDAAAEDADSPGSTTMGNAVFVLDAFSGELLRSFTTLDSTTTATSIGRSVAADVTLIDSDFDRLVDRVYAVDLGGQVYRIDFEDSAGAVRSKEAWTIYKLADLSSGTSTGRKFFFAPDVVMTGTFAALSFGSGDREKPLLSATVDHFFQVLDYRRDKGEPTAASHTPIVWADLIQSSDVGSTPAAGCYVTLAQGEKVVNAAASIGGNAFFGTNRPAPLPADTCSANLGIAKAYSMPLFCATPTSTIITGGGLPPSPVVGIVRVAYTKPDGTEGTKLKPFVIGAPNPKQSGIEVSEPVPPDEAPRKRRYWYPEVSR